MLSTNVQRSYSNQADNPYFLLENNRNNFLQTQHLTGLTIEKRSNTFRFKIAQSFQNTTQQSSEAYKPGTAFFQNGISIQREAIDKAYVMHANATYNVKYKNYHLTSVAGFNYIFTHLFSTISYRPAETFYSYKRSFNDVALNYFTNYQRNNIEASLNLTNKFYLSNTATQNNFLLPSAIGSIRFDRLLENYGLHLKLVGSISNFNSELPINQSLAHASLLRYSTQQAAQYFPMQEVQGYSNLKSIAHREHTARIELGYKNKVILSGEIFTRITRDDILPVIENNNLVLKNIAGHKNKGVEIQLDIDNYSYKKKFSIRNIISFSAYQNKVTEVAPGYNYTPVAGFSNVHTSIIKGEVVGAIVGSTYQRNEDNKIIIGADGFPLVNNALSVIGNPNPDFVMKMSHYTNWQNFSFNADIEWKKGGDVWNGTQAVLDYYGRSQNSVVLRSTTNYIFEGVTQDGHPNNTPVNFYDHNLPVQNNRWVRYGLSGVAEEYIQKGDHVRLNNIVLSYKIDLKKYIRKITFAAYVNNIMLWTAYHGADPNKFLYDQSNSAGLDFFNLPSTKTYGLNISVQF